MEVRRPANHEKILDLQTPENGESFNVPRNSPQKEVTLTAVFAAPFHSERHGDLDRSGPLVEMRMLNLNCSHLGLGPPLWSNYSKCKLWLEESHRAQLSLQVRLAFDVALKPEEAALGAWVRLKPTLPLI